jgi:hypothetical protein
MVFKLPSDGLFAGSVEFRACMDQDCVVRNQTADGPFIALLIAGSDHATAPRTVTARLTVTNHDTRAVLFAASTQATLRKIQPVSCDQGSGGYQATAQATMDGILVAE